MNFTQRYNRYISLVLSELNKTWAFYDSQFFFHVFTQGSHAAVVTRATTPCYTVALKLLTRWRRNKTNQVLSIVQALVGGNNTQVWILLQKWWHIDVYPSAIRNAPTHEQEMGLPGLLNIVPFFKVSYHWCTQPPKKVNGWERVSYFLLQRISKMYTVKLKNAWTVFRISEPWVSEGMVTPSPLRPLCACLLPINTKCPEKRTSFAT